MWCCSRSAKFLFDSVIGIGGTTEGDPDDDDSDSGSRDHVVANRSKKATARSSAADLITLDSGYLGHEVVLVKEGLRICGTGGALGKAPLVQTKSYFEVKFQQDGIWAIGVATRVCDLDAGPLGKDIESWMLRQNGELYHNNMTLGKLEPEPQEGDIIGVSYDHIELNFYINGVKGNVPFVNIRSTVFPALYVDDGAVLDAIFDGFSYPVPSGFDRIMKEKSIL